MQYGQSFAYFRDENGFPVTCVAILTTEGSTSVKYAFSTVNPHDRGKYSKPLARHIALERLKMKPRVVNVPEAGMKMNALLPLVAQAMFDDLSNGPLTADVASRYF